jgi:hypothetical protein
LGAERLEDAVMTAMMRVAQVPDARADFEFIEREIPKPAAAKCVSRCRPAAFATAMF